MEMVMSNGFAELSEEEMETVEGGGFWTVVGDTCAIAAVIGGCVVGGPLGAAAAAAATYYGFNRNPNN